MTAGASDLADAISHSVDTGLFKRADQIKGVLDDVTLVVEGVSDIDADKLVEMLRDVTGKWRSTQGAPLSRGIWYQFTSTAELIRRGDIDPSKALLDYKFVRSDDPSKWSAQLDIYLPDANKVIDPKSYSNGLPAVPADLNGGRSKALQSLLDQVIRHLVHTDADSYDWVSPNGVAGGDIEGFLEYVTKYVKLVLNRDVSFDVISDIPDKLLD